MKNTQKNKNSKNKMFINTIINIIIVVVKTSISLHLITVAINY